MNRDEILACTVNELKEKLSALNLSTTGRKQSLQDRLLEHYELQVDDEILDSSVEAVGAVRSTFTLRDIEDSLSQFNGSGQPSVEQWIEELEDSASAVQWSGLQKFIYSKQLLKGAAKIYVRSQSGICDWMSLKSALLSEFGTEVSAIEVHRMLRNRRKRQNEDYREYLYSLMEIGKPVRLDETSLIEYFIEGIPDSRSNKSNLYQAKTVQQLKEQIKVYEKIRNSRPQASSSEKSQGENKGKIGDNNKGQPKKCFKCGDPSHLANACKKPAKCFKCDQPGHKAADCSGPRVVVKQEINNASTLSNNSSGKCISKDITYKNVLFSALIDTGCDLCLIRDDIVEKLGNVELQNEQHCLIGICNSQLKTLGSFVTEVEVDGKLLEITFHVTSKNDIKYSAVIGNSVLDVVDLVVSKNSVQFRHKGTDELEKISTLELSDKVAEQDFELFQEYKDLCLFAATQDAEIDLSHLDKPLVETIKTLISTYLPENKKKSPVEMKILLSDEFPVFERPRRMSYSDKCIVDTQVQKWLDDKIIQPSSSEYASPIVLVPKKDGNKRLCCDYRRLNAKIVRDNFPMPLLDDVVERLQGHRVFTTLDLANGFFHVPVEPSSRKYTAFVTHSGQFEFLFVPFGISNSPAVFSRYVHAVLIDLVQDGTVVTYMDDLIIPSKDTDEGIQKLRRVLARAAEFGLQIKWSKCQFLMEKVDFLGYIIENGTIKPSKAKTLAVQNFPIPNDRKSLQRFLGLTSYFRRFIESYALVAKPLSDLLRKDAKFQFVEHQLVAFSQLKSALVSAPVLSLYNPKAETEVHTDASMHGYGGVLLQKNADDQLYHPIQYLSRKTKPAEEKYHSYELEVLAIVEALKKWRVYLLGIKFKIITDCNAFAMTMKKRGDIPLRVSRWALFLQDFNFEIEHRSGSKMRHVDALSRVSCLMLEDSMHHRLKQAQTMDDWVRAVMTVLDSSTYEDFYIKHGVLYKDPIKELIVVPSLMEEEIIRLAHKQGHFSAKRTQEAVEKTFFIPQLSTKVPKIVKSCVECIVSDSKAGKKEGFLTPINKEDKPLGTYHIDHVGPIEQTSKNYNYILVVVDAFSKFVWLYPTKNTAADAVVDRLKRQAGVFGNPKRIISDRGAAFVSNQFKEYCQGQGIQHLMIATGVPRGNGQVERIHKIVIPMLTKLCHENPCNWYKHVDSVQQTINNTSPRSTKISPFRLLTGFEMRLNKIPDLQEFLDEQIISEINQEREEVRKEALENIAKIQQENRRTFNKNRKKELKYILNELVAIKRTQYGTGLKIKPKYFGPYKITKIRAHGRYDVEKVGEHEGPGKTTTVAEFMKKWVDLENGSFESNEASGWPNVGIGKKTRSGQVY